MGQGRHLGSEHNHVRHCYPTMCLRDYGIMIRNVGSATIAKWHLV